MAGVLSATYVKVQSMTSWRTKFLSELISAHLAVSVVRTSFTGPLVGTM